MNKQELENRLEALKAKLNNNDFDDIAKIINEMCAVSYEIGKLNNKETN